MPFKYVKKNHPRSLHPTLCALLSCKLNCNSSCFNLHTPEELLSRAKHATVQDNKAHVSYTIVMFCEFYVEKSFCPTFANEIPIFLSHVPQFAHGKLACMIVYICVCSYWSYVPVDCLEVYTNSSLSLHFFLSWKEAEPMS